MMLKENDQVTQIIRTPQWKAKPTKDDYDEVRDLLSDFCINDVTVPECNTIAELQRFRRSIIDKYLGRK